MEKKPVQELVKEKKIYQVINPKLVKASSDISVEQAIAIMQENRSGYIVIAEENQPIGIFTEVDVVESILGKDVDWSKPVADFMTRNPFILNPKDSVGEAIKLMGDHSFYHIPLVDEENQLVGVLSVRSLIRFLAEFYPTEIYNLPPSPDQIIESREGG